MFINEFEKVFKDEFEDYLKDLQGPKHQEFKAVADRIAYYTSQMLTAKDTKRIQENIDFEMSSLASLASISVSEARERTQRAVSMAISKAVAIAFAAI